MIFRYWISVAGSKTIQTLVGLYDVSAFRRRVGNGGDWGP